MYQYNLDLKQEPFSVYGSYWAFQLRDSGMWRMQETEDLKYKAYKDGYKELVLASMDSFFKDSRLFIFEFLSDNKIIDYNAKAEIGLMTIETENGGKVEITYETANRIRIRGSKVDMQMTVPKEQEKNASPLKNDGFFVNTSAHNAKFAFFPIVGQLECKCPWEEFMCTEVVLNTIGEEFEFYIEYFKDKWSDNKPIEFEQCIENQKLSFNKMAKNLEKLPAQYLDTAIRALYTNWMCTVNSKGNIKTDAIYMSKNWMTAVWTWDNCFNTLGMADYDYELALGQYSIPFEFQTEKGMFPDRIGADEIFDSFVKPPVYGWVLLKLIEYGLTPSNEWLEYAYPHLVKLANYWETCCDWDDDKIPQYSHGNDCGWDNCTSFQVGTPIEGCDLAAYLVLLHEAIAKIAELLGYVDDVKPNLEKSQEILDALIEHSWENGKFNTKQSGTHKGVEKGDSLYEYLPIILGNRLPKDIFDKMVEDLQEPGRFLTDYGLATESLKSEMYKTDGYWRGPVWAPPMLQMIDGLKSGGAIEFSKDLAQKFCNMCSKSGFSENYNAATGEPLRDKSYTWTASVFLVLCKYYID